VESLFLGRVAPQIEAEHLPRKLRNLIQIAENIPRDECALLVSALLSTNWNKSKAAEKLRWSRMTVYRKIAKYQIKKIMVENSIQ
jgi:transcriptional regulator of acetoin/glycerol metabolism